MYFKFRYNRKNITSKTKCILHVSLNNRYKDMNLLVDLCNSKNIVLIEDSAQSLGCKINGKSLGTFGKIGCFSLSSPKIISTGQGGFCVTDDDNSARKINMVKNLDEEKVEKMILKFMVKFKIYRYTSSNWNRTNEEIRF